MIKFTCEFDNKEIAKMFERLLIMMMNDTRYSREEIIAEDDKLTIIYKVEDMER